MVLSQGNDNCVSEMRERVWNTLMTYPIKKWFNTELFIDRTTALQIGQIRIRDKTNEDVDWEFVLADWRNLVQKCYCEIICLLTDWQFIVGWGTDSSNTEVLDFTTIPYTIIVSCSHLNYPWLNFGNSDVIILCF